MRWTDDRACAYGEVQGGNRSPYGVTVIVRRSTSNRIIGIDAVCTCPVEINCKHAMALLLATETPPVTFEPMATPGPRSTVARSPAATRPTKPRSWETPLQALMSGAASGGAETVPIWSRPAEIGLQFELVLTPPKTRSSPSGSGIRVRPVLRSHSGNWVRSDISWSNLEYISFRRSMDERSAAHMAVLTELLALSRLSNGRSSYGSSYGSSPDVVWLQTITSRRLWDLLIEARDLQLPLLQSGRQAGPVELRTGTASVTLDATRIEGGLELRPRVATDDGDVPLDSSLLIGTPAHGIAWWDGPADPPGDGTRLFLAPFAAPVDEGLRHFLASTPLRVPPADEERFRRDFLPRLRRRIDVQSSDESVELPPPPPARILLTVTYDKASPPAADVDPGGGRIARTGGAVGCVGGRRRL